MMEKKQLSEIIHTNNKYLSKVIGEFHYIFIHESFDFDENLIKSIKDSRLVFIMQYSAEKQIDQFFIIGFKQTIIILQCSTENQNYKLLQDFFLSNKEVNIYLYTNKEYSSNLFSIFKDKYNFTLKSDDIFNDEIMSFCKHLNGNKEQKREITYIKKCFSGYLILDGYAKINIRQYKISTSPIFTLINEKSKSDEWKNDEFFKLRYLGSGNSSVFLIYHIPNGELFAMKIFTSDDKGSKLFKRELNNYNTINFPLMPKLINKNEKERYLIIEFINGKTLNKIKNIEELPIKERILIIVQIMLSICYLHLNEFVYRDLKSNQIIIDEYNFAYLIDFDRMRKSSDTEDLTIELQNSGEISFENDVKAIGELMHKIMNDRFGKIEQKKCKLDFLDEYLNLLYKQCINDKRDKRPPINKLLFHLNMYSQIYFGDSDVPILINKFKQFYKDTEKYENYFNEFFTQIKCFAENYPEAQFFLGKIYIEKRNLTLNIYNDQNINKSIDYLTRAANQNFSKAQYWLGKIYYEGKYVIQDMNKSIKYYTLAAEQKHKNAQLELGEIYYEGKCIARDINKSIKYYTLAAEQNDPKAQYDLSKIYNEDKYIARDINKSIHYLVLAAEQNDPKAQHDLGIIYYEGKYITRDINKSIHYFELAAKQNDPKAQCKLGIIYIEKKYVAQDINKSIKYLLSAAKANYPIAFYFLGLFHLYIKPFFNIDKSIYYLTQAANSENSEAQYLLGILYINRDIKKSIYYWTLAANHNHSKAQYNLGVYYFEGKYIKRDINKSISYFILASKQNEFYANLNLGYIYYYGKGIPRDIDKAIYYIELAAKNNFPEAQCTLGIIFCELNQIDESINYLKRAADQKFSKAYYLLGYIYYYVKHDLEKSSNYLNHVADKNYPEAQYILFFVYIESGLIDKAFSFLHRAAKLIYPNALFTLGMYYLNGQYFEPNPNIGLKMLFQSLELGISVANFPIGYLYQEGKYIQKDINKSIHHYKEASNINSLFAKNNLGVIYKNGIEVPKNIGLAIEYFNDAIKKNDKVSMFNLSLIYIYEEKLFNIDKAIDLLFQSLSLGFVPSQNLISIALILKHEYNFSDIEKEFTTRSKLNSKLKCIIDQNIKMYYKNQKYFDNICLYYEKNGYLYNYLFDSVLLTDLEEQQSLQMKNEDNYQKDITKDFFEGFYDNIS